MAGIKCPGMDPNFWKPSDITENRCPQCGNPVEFWKDDVKRSCPGCGKILFNPGIGDCCLAWCEKAAECIGNRDIEEWKRLTEQENGSKG
jgi:DNA-directed RNA polymerase subunit RPC12/RpoP